MSGRNLSEQLGEFPRRRHCGAVPDAGSESPPRTTTGTPLASRRRDRQARSTPARPHASRTPRPIPRRHRQRRLRPRRTGGVRRVVAAHARGSARGTLCRARLSLLYLRLGRCVGHGRLSHQRHARDRHRFRRACGRCRRERRARTRARRAARIRPRGVRDRRCGGGELRRERARAARRGRGAPARDVAGRRGGVRSCRLEALQRHVDRIVTAPIPTIEALGGGSVRCMLAEVFLPR